MRRSGESIAYADEGYIELTHVKDVSLTSCCHGGSGAASEVARRFAVSLDLKVVYGSSLAENRAVHFLCPPETGSMWHAALPRLASAIRFVLVHSIFVRFHVPLSSARAEDPRMVWLKDQYLFLYFQDDLCMGPLAADAIKASSKKIQSDMISLIYNYNNLSCQL